MHRVEIIAVGRTSKGPMKELCEDYLKRLKWKTEIFEIESRQSDPKKIQEDEAVKIMAKLANEAFVIVLDERGNGIRSLDFAKTIENLQNNGNTFLQFVIGGADGLTENVRDRANMLLSFGQQTWPHMLVRIMLLEQVYRSQQILAGHPYHRES